MQVVLKVLTGSSADRIAVLRQGQVLKVGRTSWADLTIDDDAELADIHFQLAVQGTACTLRKLTEEGVLAHNGDGVDEATVFDGDEVSAGNTRFLISVEGGSEKEPDEAEVAAAKGSGYPHVEIVKAVVAAADCDLDDAARNLLNDDDNPREFVERLVENGMPADAVAFLAHALPKQEVVWWGCAMVHPGDEAFDQTAYAAAKDWVLNPVEENRKAAEAAANGTDVLTPAVCLATAAYLSGGSLVDPEIAEVPPADHLTATTIAATLRSVAVLADPNAPQESLQRTLDIGIQIAEGENRWE